MKQITIIGSTGSIGTQALDIIRDHREELGVAALAAGRNVSGLEAQIREFRPALAALWEERAAEELRARVSDLPVRIVSGMDGLLEIASMEEGEIFLNAVVGMIGIRPTLAAIAAGKTIALANKETLVTAGHLIMPAIREAGVPLLPVDSEHSAIFQCMNGEPAGRVRRILLTCSGGTFRGRTREQLVHMTAKDALKNPNWSMGSKVTIDSASLVNKGLEVMEASWLFGVPAEKIEVLVQPQSLCHSAVEYVDGSIMAQLAYPDMHLPIQYAFFYPDRRSLQIPALSLPEIAAIRFERPDTETFRGLPLAYRAAAAGGSMPTVFNASNEEAVACFMRGEIEFLEICELIEGAMGAVPLIREPSLEEILETERLSREYVQGRISSGRRSSPHVLPER